MDSRLNGFSLIDALVAILVLSVSAVAFTKNWTLSYGAQNSTHVRSIASTQVAEIGNILLSHISDLDNQTPQAEVRERVEEFSRELGEHINSFAPARGYMCNRHIPEMLSVPDPNLNLGNHTLPLTWAQGAAACIQITPMPDIPTDTNGIWVRIDARWIDSHTRHDQTENISVFTLVSPL